MPIDFVELSLIVFGMVVANITWYLLRPVPQPKARLAEVVQLSHYRRR
jgi:hypothetical protein